MCSCPCPFAGPWQLAIANATHLHFQFKGIDGSNGDEFYLVKA
jgi:hypothetical protein